MPFNIGAPELIIILVIALLIIGPGKLPDVGSALGKSIREFRKASSDIQESVKVDTSPVSAPPASAPPASASSALASEASAAAPVPNVIAEAAAPNVLSQPTAGVDSPAGVEQTADVAK